MKAVDEFGYLGKGEQVITQPFTLSRYLIDVHHPNADTQMIMSYNPNWFDPRIYVRIEEEKMENQAEKEKEIVRGKS